MPTKKQLAEEKKSQYKILCEGLNKQFSFIIQLKEFYLKHGFVPPQYKDRWALFMIQDRGMLWYEQPSIVKKLKKTAKIMAKKKLGK
jgi:hypothetical protein